MSATAIGRLYNMMPESPGKLKYKLFVIVFITILNLALVVFVLTREIDLGTNLDIAKIIVFTSVYIFPILFLFFNLLELKRIVVLYVSRKRRVSSRKRMLKKEKGK